MLDFIILFLAVARITNFFVYENGPFDIFERVRRKALLTIGFWHDIFICHYCFSVWVSIFVFVVYYFIPESILLWTVFALSQASIIILDISQDE